MTVSYCTSMTDNWQHLRYIFTWTIMGRCLLVFVLVAPFVAPVAFYHSVSVHHMLPLYHVTPNSRLDHLMAVICSGMVAATYIIIFFGGLVGLYLTALIAPKVTFTIDSEAISLNTSMTARTRWKLFSTVAEEAEYFCFIGRMRAFLIPKRAFNSSAEADAFFAAASSYWRQAKGIVPPITLDVSDVWPPAPRVGDFQEPAGGP